MRRLRAFCFSADPAEAVKRRGAVVNGLCRAVVEWTGVRGGGAVEGVRVVSPGGVRVPSAKSVHMEDLVRVSLRRVKAILPLLELLGQRWLLCAAEDRPGCVSLSGPAVSGGLFMVGSFVSRCGRWGGCGSCGTVLLRPCCAAAMLQRCHWWATQDCAKVVGLISYTGYSHSLG
jgi:hypothetical protein